MSLKTFFQLSALHLAFFLCNPAFAQKKPFTGYYVTVQDDTVRGIFPKYAQWNKNPAKVEFITVGTTKEIQLTPQNTRKFVVNGNDEYLSFTGKRLVNPTEDIVLFGERFLVAANDSCEPLVTFLRLVTRTTGGNLYVFNDTRRRNFFYQLSGQSPVELKYKKAFDLNKISEISEYRQQLHNLFAEVVVQKNATLLLAKLPYTEEDLSSFFQTLFPVLKTERHPRSTAAEWVVSAGVTMNRIDVQADKSFSAVPRTYGWSFSPLLTVGFLLPVDRNFGKYFIYPQVKLFRYKNTGEENQGTFINSVTYQADLAAVAEVGGGINIINQQNIRFFVAGGFGMLAQAGAKEVKQLFAASNHTPYGSAVKRAMPVLTYSINASAGIWLSNKILLSASYVIPSTIGNFVQYTPRLSGVQLRVGYKL